jgi:polyhydroxyalkanoate synthase subunit PhaE
MSEQAQRADPTGRAFAAAVEAYQSWLRQLWAGGVHPGAAGQATHTLAGSLAEQLSAWLRQAHPLTGGWLAASQHGARVQKLLGEWTTAQSRLAAHWAAIAQAAGRQFMARIGGTIPSLEPTIVSRHYETWVECAENAYAEIASSSRYCEDQAALINATVALTAEVRRHADDVAQAFDLPTRAELNLLHRRLEELESRTRQTRASKTAKTGKATVKKGKARRAARRGRRKHA